MTILYKFPKRKYWIAYLFLTIFILSPITFMIGSIFVSNDRTINNNNQTNLVDPNKPEPPEEELTPEQEAFNELFAKVEILESLSTDIDQVVSYIRSAEYNSVAWNTLLGGTDSNFIATVDLYDNENGTNLASLKNSASRYFTIPSTEEKVDLFHMFAAIEGALSGDVTMFQTINASSIELFTGWGGDLLQLAGNFNGSTNKSEIKTSFNATIGSSPFDSADVCADLDAINIAYNIESDNTKSLYQHIIDYYKNLTINNRISQFKQNVFNETYSSSNELADIIYNQLLSAATNVGATVFNMIFGYQFNSNTTTIQLCCEVLAEYLCELEV